MVDLKKVAASVWLVFAAAIPVACTPGDASAQRLNARVEVISLAPPRIAVEGERAVGAKTWSFRNAHAGMLGLGERVGKLSLSDVSGADVSVRRLAAGEYEAERPATKFRYELTLDPPQAEPDAAHVSWLTSERGLLMPGDLLPLPLSNATLRLKLPAGWQAAALAGRGPDDALEFSEAESSVILVGGDVRRRNVRTGGLEVTFAAAGEWAFSDEDFTKAISSVLKEHARVAGGAPHKQVMVILAPFPRPAGLDRWSAETRGGTVLLLAGRAPTKTSGLVRLSLPLIHETFHLWVPNGLKLEGDYAWFYEGFTLYQSIRIGMRLGQLTFQDYLDGFAQAYDGYRRAGTHAELSLIRASERRWSGPPALVYQKGMLVAYLYELHLLKHTGGKHSLGDVYAALFSRRQHVLSGQKANVLLLDLLNRLIGDQEFTERYIKSAGLIDLASVVAPFGLQAVSPGVGRTRIFVSESLTRPQRELLSKLGYNSAKLNH